MRDMKFCDMRDYGAMNELEKKIRAWMRAELDKRGHGARSKFAIALEINPDTVTRLLNDKPGKELRVLSAAELVRAIEYFESCPAFVLAGDASLQEFVQVSAGFSKEDRRTAIDVGVSYLNTRRSKAISALPEQNGAPGPS